MKQVITKKWIHTLNAALQVPKGDNIDTSTMSRDVIRVYIINFNYIEHKVHNI